MIHSNVERLLIHKEWDLYMEPRYYLALFNLQSWIEFLEKGATTYGTTKNKLKRAEKIQSGDFFICYISKQSEFSGLVKVENKAYYDESEYWSDSVFPVRFHVQPVAILSPEKAIPIANVRNKLMIFANLKKKSYWAGFFINAFNEFPKEDGIYLMNLMTGNVKKKK